MSEAGAYNFENDEFLKLQAHSNPIGIFVGDSVTLLKSLTISTLYMCLWHFL